MKFIKTYLFAACVLTTWLGVAHSRAGVVFTNLAFFSYTNPPNYGWNNMPAGGHTSALVQGNDGDFYGTTCGGGDTVGYDGGGDGTVFQITPNGALRSLYSFDTITFELDGRSPEGNLIKGGDGNLYGTTVYGGYIPHIDNGTIYQITTNGALTTIYSFGSYGIVSNSFWPDGRFPLAGVTQGNDGNFYGTTSTSGAGQEGTVFQLTSGGLLNTLHSFTAEDSMTGTNTDGASPQCELVEGSDGNFYGMTWEGGAYRCGTIFRIGTDGTFTNLHDFTGIDGSEPNAPLVQGEDGNFYGTTLTGGGSGTFFQITTNGQFTLLYTFNGYNTNPSGLIQGSDGNFYGTTMGGGNFKGYSSGYGTVFRITTNGALTTLYSFSGPDGETPQGALVQAKDGSLYGTTSYGGTNFDTTRPVNSGYGAIFHIIIPPAFQTITKINVAGLNLP